jgi:hypothetical protein
MVHIGCWFLLTESFAERLGTVQTSAMDLKV